MPRRAKLTDANWGENVNPFSLEFVDQELEWYGKVDFEKGDITIRSETVPFTRLNDYFNKAMRSGVFPIYRENGSVWMSMTPMEIQSQFVPISRATGSVATAGLGLGYFAARVMGKDDVKKVTVFERKQECVEFFTSHFSERKGFEKVEFVIGDAREKLRGYKFDFLYNDIYPTLLGPSIPDDVTLFQSRNSIRSPVFYWGMERFYLHAWLEHDLCASKIPEDIAMFFKKWLLTTVSEAWGQNFGDSLLQDLYDQAWLDDEYIERMYEAMCLQ